MTTRSTNPAGDVDKLEKHIAQLEKEQTAGLAKLDKQIEEAKNNPFARNGLVEELEWKREGLVKGVTEMIQRQKDALTVRRAELADWQAEQQRQQQEAADKQERQYRTRARASFPGTDADFAAAWPSMWRTIREQLTVAAAQKSEPPLQRIQF